MINAAPWHTENWRNLEQHALCLYRIEGLGPKRHIVPVEQRDRHALGLAVYGNMAEKLQIECWRNVLALLLGRCLRIHELRAKGLVESVRAERASMDRPRYEFPERVEVLEFRFIRVVVVGRRIVHIGRQPQGIAHLLALDEGKYIRDLKLASQGRPVVGLGNVEIALPVRGLRN